MSNVKFPCCQSRDKKNRKQTTIMPDSGPIMTLCVHSNFFLQDFWLWQSLCHEDFRKNWSFSRL